MRKFLKNENGQSVVELALIMPVFLLIISAVIDFGWLFSNKLMIANFAREGARFGAVNTSSLSSATEIKNQILSIIPEYARDDVDISVEYTNELDVRSGDIKIIISYPVDPLSPLTNIFAPGEKIDLVAQCVMKVE